ncbi:CCR4-NOT transcriptional regulation complex%2C NOT5 subunit [Chlamydia trachomatis]|nr:CCR4-NOT transcriptional regulation complex%2C NOT5 subunit [Chlamydia trachomatis]
MEKLIHAPEDFPAQNANLDNIIICMTALNGEHRVQFLIGDNHRSFWIRHHDGESWSKWSTFI